ncbi:MAG: Acetyltransferase [Paenibacillaceae bacterium]|jgi:predicted acetyltransferase|nr:Acetyltransferase [Paenibacillaceae bacterium]
MEDEVFLVSPTVDLEEEYMDYYREWKASGERLSPGVITKSPADFPAMVKELEEEALGLNLREGYVQSSTFWLVNRQRRVLAAVSVRHTLNEKLQNIGGHIGYGVRPSERRKGYAARMLALALEYAAAQGLERVLVTCDESNIGSEKTILRNGGAADTPFTEESGNVVKRYWITCGD